LRAWQPLIDPAIDAQHAQTLLDWRRVLLRRHKRDADDDDDDDFGVLAGDGGDAEADVLDLLVGSDSARY
jgi:hypothetical protein